MSHAPRMPLLRLALLSVAGFASGCPWLDLALEPDRPPPRDASTHRPRPDRGRARRTRRDAGVHARPGPAVPARRPGATDGPVTDATLRVTFLDVGQGDGALLETADGHAGLIDTGPPEARARVLSRLAEHHVTRLDWMLLSHPHLDHIGNAAAVLDAVAVDTVLDPAFPHPIATYDRLLAKIEARAVPYRRAAAGTTLALGARVAVELLGPRQPFLTDTRSDVNANSVIARVRVGSVSVLFAGDAELPTEQRLLADTRASLASDVLKVAHHGSRYASSDAFLDAVAPRFAVISCAQGNDFGHPHAATLAALARHRAVVFRTDAQGEIVLRTDGEHVAIDAERSATAEQLASPGDRRDRGRER